MAKKTNLGVVDVYNRFLEEFEVLSESEANVFQNMSEIVHNYPFDFFNVKTKEELTQEFGVVISAEFRKALHWYRVYLALCDYISWDFACEDEMPEEDEEDNDSNEEG